MDEKKLRKALSQLPVIPVGTIANDHQIIEGNEDSAHYKITKETPSNFPSLTLYSLSISGSSESRKRLIDCFTEVLGPPLNRFQSKVLPGIDFICWDAKEIDKKSG